MGDERRKRCYTTIIPLRRSGTFPDVSRTRDYAHCNFTSSFTFQSISSMQETASSLLS